MINVHCWNPKSKTSRAIDSAQISEQLEKLNLSDELAWIDLYDPTEDEESLVFERFFRIHPLTLEDITRLRRYPNAPPHFPKAEEFPDYLFVVANPLGESFMKAIRSLQVNVKEAEHPATTQLSAVLTSRILITHHYEPVASINDCRGYLHRHETHGERGPDYVFHLILDATVDEYAVALEHFQEALDEAEAAVFEQPNHTLLLDLLRLKRHIVILRKTLVHEREVLARLSRGEFSLIDEREMIYYRNVYDHLVRFTELIETSREMVSDLMQTHLAATSNKLNQIMKFLTMISTVVLPMSLIAGIYGMNFKHQPEFEWAHGYPWALGLMAMTGIGAIALFRWKRWI
jgi:magnesium transporter